MDDEDNPPPRLISIPGNELSPRTTSRASRQIPPYLPSKSSNRPRVPSFDGKERCSEQEFELVDRMEHRRLSSPTMQDLEVLSYSFTADNDDEVVEPSFTRRNDRLNLDNDAGVRLSIISASEYGDQSRQEEKSHYYPPDHKPLHSRPTELDFTKIKNIRKSIISLPPTLNSPPGPEDKKKPSITPTLALLFSLTSRPSTIAIVLPAVGLSVVAGLIPPYMTELIGVAFQAFTTYALILATEPTDDILSAAKVELLKSTKNSAFQFCGLAGLILVASTVGIGLWVINGERVVRALRKEVFTGVGAREMAWFDLGMGANGEKEEAGEEESEGGQGVGGLMGRFARGTDEVRTATSQTLGLILQYFISFLACLGLSFYRNALLTIVVLSSIPMIIGIVAVTEKMATSFSEKERDFAAKAAGRADRVLAAIPTIKAFNAEIKESEAFDGLNHKASEFYSKLHLIWGIRAGVTQFILLAMFVQGFWFGSYLVQTGKSSPAAVNTCFWACLLASTYLQLCLPMLVTLEKGKLAMADLLGLARVAPEVERPKSIISLSGSAVFLETKKLKKIRRGSSEPFAGQGIVNTLALPPTIHENLPPLSPSPSNFGFPQSPSSPLFVPLAAMGGRAIKRRGGAPRSLQKIRPTKFSGELSLKNVTFHYPSRPHPSLPALDNVSLYLAAKETTFIVGGSGSGKSTVGNLLLGLYKPEMGTIEVEEQGLEWIDEQWLRGHVACVSQGASVIFDGTVHDNVTIGVVGQIRKDGTRRDPKDVSREEVEKACRSALVHEFVRDLPEGYDTFLSVGATLSGGQRQRLALARAWLRDPTVLILDEATSALDATSRLLVSEAVKIWRQNKTTIVITHDLTPIGPADFVYVMTNGVVAEAGFRRDLELNIGGPFCELAGTQADPTKPKDNLDETESLADEPEWTLADDSYYQMNSRRPSAATIDEIEYIEPPYRNSTFAGSGMFPPTNLVRQAQEYGEIRRVSAAFLNNRKSGHGDRRRTQMEPPRYDFASLSQSNRASNFSFIGLENAAQNAASKRPGGKRIRHKTMIEGDGLGKEWSEINRKKAADGIDHIAIEVENSTEINMALMELARKLYPTIPNKYLFWLGLFSSIAVGACTPVFSSLLARLMANLGNPNAGNLVITTSLLILLMAFIDGVFTFLKFYVLERCGMGWIVSLRSKSLTLVLKQDKSFFDKSENSTSSLVNILIKDSEDARTLVGTIVGQMFVVVSMIFIGIVWAFAVGWELTLVGLGLAPVFVVATRLQATVIARFEGKNKRMREDITKKFHQVISNIRAIRAMSIEPVFVDRFEESIEKAYVGGAKAAPFAGFGFGLGASLTYIAEALMFYVGALLIASGKYTFVKMIEVFTLIIFSVTFSSQIMTYLPQMTKSIRAAIDLTRLLDLESETEESQGRMTFPISGNISFNNVIFAYPTRPSVPILKGMSFEIKPGECVGIVGASGSGKSTVASLLQRLYEPTLGSITLDGRQLSRTDVRYLRDHIAIVSQHPALFDMTIAENIAYGCNALSQDELVTAAILAQVHDFIISLPKGYATMLGENASLISGGQAQRLQIARALVRHRELLILDECTSALDAQNQAGIMETIMKAKIGKTTVIVTHKLAVMEMCDRLLVVVDGKVVESGTPEELKLRSGGIFKSMASAGEWSG